MATLSHPRPANVSIAGVENHRPVWIHVWVCDYCAGLVLADGREQHERAHRVERDRHPHPEET